MMNPPSINESSTVHRKKLIVVDKTQFLNCKKLLLEKAADSDFANCLGIPEKQVSIFREEVKVFEDVLCKKRRADNLKKERQRYSVPKKRRERARELLAANIPTNKIAKMMRLAESTIKRFRSRMFREKRKLKEEGNLDIDVYGATHFRHLPNEEKLVKIREQFEESSNALEIAKKLKITEKSVKRWKARLDRPDKFHQFGDPLTSMVEPEPSGLSNDQKKAISAERFQHARELISKNLGTNQIARIMKLSERSVTRFKKKMREEELGKVEECANVDADDENSFKKLRVEEKLIKVKELVRKGLTNVRISTILGISDRSVQRWKGKLKELNQNITLEAEEITENSADGSKLQSESIVEGTESGDDLLEPVRDMFEEHYDGMNFKELNHEAKIKRVRGLVQKGLSSQDIAEVLKLNERTAQRWKEKLEKMNNSKFPSTTEEGNNFKELTSEEKLKKIKELVNEGLSNPEISELLNLSERSVQRWKVKIEKVGEDSTSNDLVDDSGFKQLPYEIKLIKIKDLFRRGLKTQEISDILKLNERSVQRWKVKLEEAGEYLAASNNDENSFRELKNDKKLMKIKDLVRKGLKTQEIAEILKLNERSVQRWKTKIEEMDECDAPIDTSTSFEACMIKTEPVSEPESEPELPEKIPTLKRRSTLKVDQGDKKKIKAKPRSDRSNDVDFNYLPLPSNSVNVETGGVLCDRNMYIARLLREHEIRTMDIAKLMKISERSVTRLLEKSKRIYIVVYEDDVVAEVQRLLADKERILNSEEVFNDSEIPGEESPLESKRKIAVTLFSMNAEINDIAEMLGVSKKMIQQWKKQEAK